MSRRTVSGAIAVVLLLTAVSMGVVSARRVQRQARVGDLCDMTRESRWDEALAIGESVAGADGEGRIAAECLCWAYAARDRLGDCTKLVDRLAFEDAIRHITGVLVANIGRRLLRRRDTGDGQDYCERQKRSRPCHVDLSCNEVLRRGEYSTDLGIWPSSPCDIREQDHVVSCDIWR